MRHLSEYRDSARVRRLADEIGRLVTRSCGIMEVCGGQTHSILRNGIDQLLPDRIRLIHGPGCPVCVTPVQIMDHALSIAAQPNVIFCSFGDMLRVPGSSDDLFGVRSRGADVRIVYSPLDALQITQREQQSGTGRQVVFFAVGFETTAPANAMTVKLARDRNVTNFSLLVSHVQVPPALDYIMSSSANQVDAFLAAGHVCSVMGHWQYHEIAQRYRVPIVVTGFEPLDLLEGIRRTVLQLNAGRHEVENAYARVVSREGNTEAQAMIRQAFTTCDQEWRGIGIIPRSGWKLRDEYRDFDAAVRFPQQTVCTAEAGICRAGEVLQGVLKPDECPAFGKECTPQTPLGATMVSSEGACAAYYNYRRHSSEKGE
ncbi:MAG: hydrogenase formation protein HypD [Planctomycetaceae bacterium]|nr:hydrogenase formation protein HypD [Planctomycetaceae bacterium]